MLTMKDQSKISDNHKFNIVDVLLLDHEYLKDCIKVLKDEEAKTSEKMKYARGFLDALKKHSEGEKNALYKPLEEQQDIRSIILESEIEHGIVDKKVKFLQGKIEGKRSLDDQLEAEFKVLAEVVEHHLKEEEEELFPQMREQLKPELLNEMGFQFMTIRQFSAKDLEEEPELQRVIPFIRKQKPKTNSAFKKETHKYLQAQ